MGAREPTYFESEADFRRWLEREHGTAAELLVGFHKKKTGLPSIDWPQARDQALCFGWIDGVRKSLGDSAYTIRFTPRRKGSIWSRVNIERFKALKAAGQVTEPGELAYEEGKERTDHYAYENEERSLSAEEEKAFRANEAAWKDFERRPASYRKRMLFWITSAKRSETRAKRLATLIADSAAGREVGGT
ncbi:MAG TPA: YdeI/OmpD-associated family protein [Allosphingosinicella sp.]